MIEGKTVLAIIPARGGSRGVPRKNIREVAGKPLIAWTIEEARKSIYIDRLVLSSEDEEIITVAKAWGCEVPFIRPRDLARDETPGIEPVLHTLKTLPGYDYVILLQPTSPLRSVTDIDSCLERCVLQQANTCVSVTEPEKSPYWMYTVDPHGKMQPLIDKEITNTRRQDLPKVYVLNGAVYVAQIGWLLKNKSFLTSETVAYFMPKKRSLDIDTELDIKMLEYFLVNISD